MERWFISEYNREIIYSKYNFGGLRKWLEQVHWVWLDKAMVKVNDSQDIYNLDNDMYDDIGLF